MRDDEIRRKNLLKLCKFLIDRQTEVCDLLLIAHIDRQGDCTAALSLSSGVQPRVIVKICCGSLIDGKNHDQITQKDGNSMHGLRVGAYLNCFYNFVLAV